MHDAVDDLVRRLPSLGPCQRALERSIELVAGSLRGGGKLLVCGNGGSASDSEHLVADLMKGFVGLRPIPGRDRVRLREIAGPSGDEISAHLQGALAAIALSSSGALMTAVANDVRYEMVFAQQVYGLGRPGDVLLAISTTGNSMSVVNAVRVARLREMGVIALTGRDGGDVANLADIAIRVPADRVFEIQEYHLPIYHALALALERSFFGNPASTGADDQTRGSVARPRSRGGAADA
jgi:D-sedoheptulose 7-phosphate isomerase